MSYLTCGIQERLQQAFARHSMCLDVKSDYVIVENSSKCTEEKVKEIVVGAGFCPFVAPYRMEGKVVFTISPYQVPGGFTQIAPMIQVPLEEKAPYFGVDELSNVLRSRLFVDSEKNPCAEDKWDRVNWNRQFVSSALEEALSEIIAPRMKEGHPAVEIGSGIGYSLPKTVSSQTIRIQPSLPECQLLRKAISDPIYQMNIEDLYALLLGSGKKIPLIFALNVFDTMSSDERSANLERLSRLQNLGDRILIMLDNNPLLSKALKVLKELRPGFVAYPYIPLTRDVCTPLSVILVPESHCPTDLTLYDFDQLEDESYAAIQAVGVSKLQQDLHKLQKELNLSVVSLEDIFVTQVKNELKKVGYTPHSFYHAAFTTGELSPTFQPFKQDLIYKPVTDAFTIRACPLDDAILQQALAKKNLRIPDQFDTAYAEQMREKGQKVFGAEILVIEATKEKLPIASSCSSTF